MKNKEFGSDFNFPDLNKWGNKSLANTFTNKLSLYLSGRVALHSLLEYGIKQFNWKRVYLPSYYCYDVTNFLEGLNIEIIIYNYNPFLNSNLNFSEIKNTATTVFVKVNYFGIEELILPKKNNMIVIEDLSHNISSIKDSQADYVFGSLRKELPIPVGGFLYSNEKGLPFGSENSIAELISEEKENAMKLKAAYLNSEIKEKGYFRELFVQSEEKLVNKKTEYSKLPQNALKTLKSLNVEEILEAKKRNLKVALNELINIKNVTVNNNRNKGFGLLLFFADNIKRESVRIRLIKNKIYPSVLWPEQKNKIDIDVQSRILFIHVDFRYNLEDIKQITKVIKESIINV